MSGGHTQLDWQNPSIVPEIKRYKYLPFTAKLNSAGQLEVTRSASSFLKTGNVIEEINNIPAIQIYRECMDMIGGIESFKNAGGERFLPLYQYFTNTAEPPYKIRILNDSIPVLHQGLDVNEMVQFVNEIADTEDYHYKLVESNIGLLTYNSCNDYKKFKKFLKGTFAEIAVGGVDYLIIDIRNNPGGNSSLNDLLLSYLTDEPYQQSSKRYWKVSERAKIAYSANSGYSKMFGKDFINSYLSSQVDTILTSEEEPLTIPITPKNRFNGKVAVLIGPDTFSSANMLADAIKTYNIAVLIGSPTGELTNDFGEQLTFELNHSRSTVYVSSTYDIGANGDETLFSPVLPDIQVETHDALDYAIEHLSNKTDFELLK
jgi:C-terminal processing protease CtpA/Prc